MNQKCNPVGSVAVSTKGYKSPFFVSLDCQRGPARTRIAQRNHAPLPARRLPLRGHFRRRDFRCNQTNRHGHNGPDRNAPGFPSIDLRLLPRHTQGARHIFARVPQRLPDRA